MSAPQYVVTAGALMVVPPHQRARDVTEGLRPAATRWAAMMLRDWTQDVVRTWELVVYVARYGKQPIDHVERWPLSKLLRVTRLVSANLEAEAKAASRPKSAW